jgi:anti-sigma factor RsiW
MNCRQVCELLERYVSGETNGTDAQAVEAHLAACSSCQVERDTLRMVRSALDGYPRLKASPDFDVRVLEAVMARTAKSHSFLDRLDALFARPLYKLLASASLGVAIALLTVSVMVLPHAHRSKTSAPSGVVAAQSPTSFIRSREQVANLFYDRWLFEDDNTAETPAPRRSHQPQGRKSSWDANTSALPSSPRFGSWC